jgi:hypothetical protein
VRTWSFLGPVARSATDCRRSPSTRCALATPEDTIDYDDGPTGPVWGYDWQAHLAADAAGWALAVGTAAALGWLTLVVHPASF